MNKSAFPAALLLLAVASSGCPVYDSSDRGCYDDWDCRDGDLCDYRSGLCVSSSSSANDTCQRPGDCGTNETCSRSGTCTIGDCHFESVGCVRGYRCSSESGRWECVAASDQGEGGENAGGAEGGSTAGASGAGGDASAQSGGASGAPESGPSGAGVGQAGGSAE